MSDYVFQDYKGQTFDQAVQSSLAWRIEVSGYESESDPQYRYWWAVCQTPAGEYKVIAGRVTHFSQGGWGYKIEESKHYLALTNPPMKVRKAIVSKGLTVPGVYEPGVTSKKFALMDRRELTKTIKEALQTKDEAYLLDAVANTKSTAAQIISDVLGADFMTDYCMTLSISEAVLAAVIEHLNERDSKTLTRLCATQ